jgi:hypothetical protein
MRKEGEFGGAENRSINFGHKMALFSRGETCQCARRRGFPATDGRMDLSHILALAPSLEPKPKQNWPYGARPQSNCLMGTPTKGQPSEAKGIIVNGLGLLMN